MKWLVLLALTVSVVRVTNPRHAPRPYGYPVETDSGPKCY